MKNWLLLFLTTSVHFLFAQNDTLHTRQDSVFTTLGDTLVGQITIDKDNNQYLFKSATADSATLLLPSKTKRLRLFSKENSDERQIYNVIFDNFYLLELGENDIITLFARHLYTKVTDDGPTYYTVKKKYCLIKNKILYNLRPESLKADLLILTDDCANMTKKIKQQKKILFEDVAAFITEYNHCGDVKK
jgi:hypothetical protein